MRFRTLCHLQLLLGTNRTHLRPKSGRRYINHLGTLSQQNLLRLNTRMIASLGLTLAHNYLKLKHGRSRLNLAALGCYYYYLVLYL